MQNTTACWGQFEQPDHDQPASCTPPSLNVSNRQAGCQLFQTATRAPAHPGTLSHRPRRPVGSTGRLVGGEFDYSATCHRSRCSAMPRPAAWPIWQRAVRPTKYARHRHRHRGHLRAGDGQVRDPSAASSRTGESPHHEPADHERAIFQDPTLGRRNPQRCSSRRRHTSFYDPSRYPFVRHTTSSSSPLPMKRSCGQRGLPAWCVTCRRVVIRGLMSTCRSTVMHW